MTVSSGALPLPRASAGGAGLRPHARHPHQPPPPRRRLRLPPQPRCLLRTPAGPGGGAVQRGGRPGGSWGGPGLDGNPREYGWWVGLHPRPSGPALGWRCTGRCAGRCGPGSTHRRETHSRDPPSQFCGVCPEHKGCQAGCTTNNNDSEKEIFFYAWKEAQFALGVEAGSPVTVDGMAQQRQGQVDVSSPPGSLPGGLFLAKVHGEQKLHQTNIFGTVPKFLR